MPADPSKIVRVELHEQAALSKTVQRTGAFMESLQLTIVGAVTSKHGHSFARRWFDESCATGAIFEACRAAELVGWLDDEEMQERVNRIEDEICERTFESVEVLISKAFVKAATEVLARERSAQKRDAQRPEDR